MKDPAIFVEHILESMNNIEDFTKDVSKELFFKDKEKQSAVVRQIEIIGEAAKNLPDAFKKKYKNIPWKEMVGTRDKAIHHYFGLDLEIIWEIIKVELPRVKKNLQRIQQIKK